ncbi:short-chain dehydrogenase/reductase family 9C member 7 isoform X3 [Cheilinus undulatus]|uniref:short-chain dehydrogenase/reductase family 9C member 7 isoform X3 n=1 Tax=Cheilinus undulatus TaxID=241271 RepID=UPI001BD435E2|nr:short-chain dehydrogenase/reductase family 9C member 7 isoform X3 [Cheilinus undulatus]
MTELTDAQSQRGEQAHRRSVNMFETLQGNILVTGANRGIGLELVAQLAQQVGKDAHLFACCREPEGSRAQALRDLSAQHPGKITTICLDLSDEESISAAVQAVSDQIGDGGLNLLINNAAINTPAKPAPLSTTEKQHMMEVYETNVVGPFLLAKKFLPLLQRAAESYTPEHDTGCSQHADSLSGRRLQDSQHPGGGDPPGLGPHRHGRRPGPVDHSRQRSEHARFDVITQ